MSHSYKIQFNETNNLANYWYLYKIDDNLFFFSIEYDQFIKNSNLNNIDTNYLKPCICDIFEISEKIYYRAFLQKNNTIEIIQNAENIQINIIHNDLECVKTIYTYLSLFDDNVEIFDFYGFYIFQDIVRNYIKKD